MVDMTNIKISPVNSQLNNLGQTQAMLCAINLDKIGLMEQIQLGANLNQKDFNGRTVLHFLSRADNSGDTLIWFRQKNFQNIDINALTKGNVTPLMNACKTCCTASVAQLLEMGANPFLKD